MKKRENKKKLYGPVTHGTPDWSQLTQADRHELISALQQRREQSITVLKSEKKKSTKKKKKPALSPEALAFMHNLPADIRKGIL